MKTIIRGLTRPLPAWITLMLFAVVPLTATAAYPTLWANWVVANASVTPSPGPTGYSGPVVVAQPTAAPTVQPGTIAIQKVCTFNCLTGVTGDAVVGRSTTAGCIDWTTLTASPPSLCYGSVASGAFGVYTASGSGLPFQAGSSTSGTTPTYVPPVFTDAGAAVASTLHAVIGTQSITTTSGCAQNSCGGGTIIALGFSGAAAFSSGTSYSCSGNFTNAGFNGVTVDFWNQSATAIDIGISNISSATVPAGTYTVAWMCIGT